MIRNTLALVFGCCVVHLVYNGILKLDLLWSWNCRNLKIGNRKKRKRMAHPMGQNQHCGPNFMPRSAHFSPSLFIFLHDTARWAPFVGLPGTAALAANPHKRACAALCRWCRGDNPSGLPPSSGCWERVVTTGRKKIRRACRVLFRSDLVPGHYKNCRTRWPSIHNRSWSWVLWTGTHRVIRPNIRHGRPVLPPFVETRWVAPWFTGGYRGRALRDWWLGNSEFFVVLEVGYWTHRGIRAVAKSPPLSLFPSDYKTSRAPGTPLHPTVSRHSIPPSSCGRQELFPHQLRAVAAGSHRGRGIDLKDPFRGKGGPQGKARWHLQALGSPVAVLFALWSRWLLRCHLGPWAGDATAP
jgi:hypothetical protein